MGTKASAIAKGYQLPDGTLEPTDVLVAIDFNSTLPGGPLKGGEFADTHFAQRLRALREFVGMTLDGTIQAMKMHPNMPWNMHDYNCHVARGRCIVGRDGELLDHRGRAPNTTPQTAT
jgi:hypothetical protein